MTHLLRAAGKRQSCCDARRATGRVSGNGPACRAKRGIHHSLTNRRIAATIFRSGQAIACSFARRSPISVSARTWSVTSY
jgi:hypothetical protein